MNALFAAGLSIVAAFGWVIACYHTTAAEVFSIWWRSDTFAHGLLVLPIFGWLVWRARARLEGLHAAPTPLMALPLLLAALLWLLGQLASVASVTHTALALLLVLSLFGSLGPRLARPLAFPILFLFFGVPIGEFLLPLMMKYTAIFAVAAVRLSGIPVYQEGLHFVVPNGRWSVVEACSGVRYLIASLMVGTLYAYLSYRSLKRRLIFVAFAILVPVIANWLRAYMIVMIGYFSDNRLGTGVDHLLYGWVFFGIVILLMFWIGGSWREDLDPLPEQPGRGLPSVALPLPALLLRLLPLALAVVAGPLALHYMERTAVAATPAPPTALALAGPWSEVTSAAASDFRPAFSGFQTELQRRYSDGKNSVSVYVATYADQAPGRELVQSDNMLLLPADLHWGRLHEGSGAQTSAGTWGRSLLSSGGTYMVVWSAYWINGRLVSSDYMAKALLALQRLQGHPDTSAFVALWATGLDEAGANAQLEAFEQANGAAVLTWLAALAGPR